MLGFGDFIHVEGLTSSCEYTGKSTMAKAQALKLRCDSGQGTRWRERFAVPLFGKDDGGRQRCGMMQADAIA